MRRTRKRPFVAGKFGMGKLPSLRTCAVRPSDDTVAPSGRVPFCCALTEAIASRLATPRNRPLATCLLKCLCLPPVVFLNMIITSQVDVWLLATDHGSLSPGSHLPTVKTHAGGNALKEI